MIEFNKKEYKLKINEVSGKIEFLGKCENILSENQPPVFELCVLNSDGEKKLISAFDAAKIFAELKDENSAVIHFSEFENHNLSVELSVFCDSQMVHWSISVNCEDRQLEWVNFPEIAVKDTFKGKGGNSKILLPFNEGVLIDDIDFRNIHGMGYTEPVYPSEGKYTMCPGMISTPMIAVINERESLYFAAHDPEQNTKNVDFYRFQDGIKLQIRLYPGVAGGIYKTSYDTVLGIFNGDWHEAAEIYRSWFEEFSAKKYVKISENSDLPKWYGESPVVVVYTVRGHHDTDEMNANKLFPYSNALPIIKKISEKTGSPVMALLMHWEGTAPWAPPYVWPPFGGEQVFGEFLNKLHCDGNYLGVYCSGLGWTQKSNLTEYSREKEFEEKNLADFMCAAPDQSVSISRICTDQRMGYDMCPATQFCKKTLVNEVKKIIGSGVDYIQLMDQNHGGTPYFCYSKSHGHPPVPGKWQSEELKEILQKIREEQNGGNVLLGCESAAAETFIPQMLFSDNRFELDYMLGVPVPLYSYLYHTYLNNFMGNQVCGEGIMDCYKSKDNLLYRIAYSLICGDFLTIVINDDGEIQWSWGQKNFEKDYMPDSEKTLQFINSINKWRIGNSKKYLHTGKMIKPYEISGLKNHIIFAGKREMEVPNILSSRYMAEDNTCGQFLVNYTDNYCYCNIKCKSIMKLYQDPQKDDYITVSNKDVVEISPLSAILLVD